MPHSRDLPGCARTLLEFATSRKGPCPMYRRAARFEHIENRALALRQREVYLEKARPFLAKRLPRGGAFEGGNCPREFVSVQPHSVQLGV